MLTGAVSQGKLCILSDAIDRLIKWALKTLSTLTINSSPLLMWLRACYSDTPERHPFCCPQDPTTVKRYVHRWKEFMFYVLRTFSLDETTRAREYGIHFTEDQLRIIEELVEILDEYTEDDEEIDYSYEERDDESDEDEESDDEDEENDEDHQNGQDDNLDVYNNEGMDEDYSQLLTRIAEKVMQLSIAFITQYFPGGEDLRSPLIHFADVMGISNKLHRFQEPYNYTSHVAALIWICRLLVMEYPLPTREYTTLGWPAGETYPDKGERFRWLHRTHLTLGSFCPMTRFIRILGHGRETVRAVGRPSLIYWDPDHQGFQLKEIQVRLDVLKQFIGDGIKLTEKILREHLFFGLELPKIDLNSLHDVVSDEKPLYSFIAASAASLPEGCAFMLNLMKWANPSKHLIEAQGQWDRIKVLEYLKVKKTFLRQLMKGMTTALPWLMLDLYLTGGQPFRGRELGSTKFQNTQSCLRNLFVTHGEAFISTEYHKARTSTNYSFCVVRYLPESVATLVALYIIYVRPFAKMLFNNIVLSQQTDLANTVINKARPSRRAKRTMKPCMKIEKQVGRRRIQKRGQTPVDLSDPGYIFCSDESPNKCWTGTDLSEILQKESSARLGVRINLWAWRHIIIRIAKEHLEEVAPFFEGDEPACKELLETNVYYSIFPWQAGHQRRIHTDVYGLDAAFPARLQKALRHFYRQISRLWHYWLGLLNIEPRLQWPILVENKPPQVNAETQTTPKKARRHSIEAAEGHLTPESAVKRRRLMDSEVHTTPKKECMWLEVRPEDSPQTKRPVENARQSLDRLVKNTRESLDQIRGVVEKRRESRGF